MERIATCPYCGGKLQVQTMVLEMGVGAKARWKDSTPEERAEQGRKLAEGRAKAKPTKDIERAVKGLVEEKAGAIGKVRPTDICTHGTEYRHCRTGMCQVALNG